MDQSLFIPVRYFDTYYFAMMIERIILEPWPYLRRLGAFFDDVTTANLIHPFQRWTPLHQFVYFVVYEAMVQEASQVQNDFESNGEPVKTLAEWALDHHGVEHEAVVTTAMQASEPADRRRYFEERIEDFHQGQEFDDLLSQLTNEVFHLLFLNRGLLRAFSEYVSRYLVDLDCADYTLGDESHNLVTKSGRPKRKRVPKWAQSAVYYRDRGRCVFCRSDLSGLQVLGTDSHFDHVVPLALGGMNCVTNLQLLCKACNLAKGKKPMPTSTEYQTWC